MNTRVRKMPFALLAGVAALGALWLSGCGGPASSSPLARKAAEMFSRDGLLKDQVMQEFIAMPGSNKEKIQLMQDILRSGSVIKHLAATQVIAKIDDPYRIDALIDIIDNYGRNKEISEAIGLPQDNKSARDYVRAWAFTGLALSFDRRAYDKLFELLETEKNPNTQSAILHELGCAPINAKDLHKELPDSLRRDIEKHVREMLDHENISVREHAKRALERLQGNLRDVLP